PGPHVRSKATWNHPDLGRVRAASRLDALGHAQALGIDDADAVRQAVRRVDLLAVGRDGDAPRPPAHLLADGGHDLVGGRVHDVHRAGAAAGDVDAAAGGIDGDLHRARVEAQVD